MFEKRVHIKIMKLTAIEDHSKEVLISKTGQPFHLVKAHVLINNYL